jgi:hypothetical protein
MGQRVKDMPEGMTLNESTRMGYVSMGISNGIGRYVAEDSLRH